MNTLSATASLLAHSLAWALLYSLWQGLLICLTLYVILKALPNVNARVKYYLSMSSLAAMFLWFADTWFSQYQRLKGITVYITQSGIDTDAVSTYSAKTTAAGAIQSPLLSRIIPHLEHYFPFIILIYSAGLTFMLCRFLVNILQLSTLRKEGLINPGQFWNDFVLHWQDEFAIVRPVRLFLSDRVNVPMMLGTIKPIILLPVAAINHLTTEQMEAILLHELAHIKRHDYLLNIFQVITETILFFNPFVWLVSGIARREREHCCDDLVVSCSADPLPYAKALAILEGRRLNNKFTLAATGQNNQLFHRIKRIMEMKKNNINYSQLAIIIVAFLAIIVTISMFTFTPVLAQKAKGGFDDSTKKSAYHYKTVTVDPNGKKTVTEKESSKPIKDKSKEGDNVNVDVNVTTHDDDDEGGKNKNAKTYSYTYSYSTDDDMKKMEKEIKSAVDAVANIDFTEIEKEVEDGRKEIEAIDWNAIREDIDKGLEEVKKELHDPKLSKEVNKEIKIAMEQGKEAMEKAEEKMKTLPVAPPAPPVPPMPPSPPIAPTPPGAHSDIHTNSGSYESMLKKMENEGLIDRSGNYKIEKEDGELYINGQRQSEEVYHKYAHYLNDKKVMIKGHKGTLTIKVTD